MTGVLIKEREAVVKDLETLFAEETALEIESREAAKQSSPSQI